MLIRPTETLCVFESRHLRLAFFRVLIGGRGIDKGMTGKANPRLKANVAELVNATVSKIVDSLEKGLRVQIPPLAFKCEV